MNKREAQEQLAESLILLAEALLAGDDAGQFTQTEENGELKITSTTRDSTTIVVVKEWIYKENEDEWAEYLEV